MISATEALERLREGNRRFVAGSASPASRTHDSRLVCGQAPFAIILGCSDSRVPAELILDQGVGDLFVVRVAGNIAAPSQVGSVEFAATQFGTRLVVVLGHSQCGAVRATLEHALHPEADISPALRSIVHRIRPSVEPLLETELRDATEALVKRAVRANVRATAAHLQRESQVLARLVRDDGLEVVGAEYSLETGAVEFFDGVALSD